MIILLDSLTRLARGHNNAQSGGPIGSEGSIRMRCRKAASSLALPEMRTKGDR